MADDSTSTGWVFIGVFVLAACLLLVPHGNAASVKVPPVNCGRVTSQRQKAT